MSYLVYELDEWFYVLGIVGGGNMVYGPYDGDPLLVEGYVWTYEGEGTSTPTCAHIYLQENWPK